MEQGDNSADFGGGGEGGIADDDDIGGQRGERGDVGKGFEQRRGIEDDPIDLRAGAVDPGAIAVEQFIGGMSREIATGEQEEIGVAVAESFEVIGPGFKAASAGEPLVQGGRGGIALHHEDAAALMAKRGGEGGGNERLTLARLGAGDEDDAAAATARGGLPLQRAGEMMQRTAGTDGFWLEQLGEDGLGRVRMHIWQACDGGEVLLGRSEE